MLRAVRACVNLLCDRSSTLLRRPLPPSELDSQLATSAHRTRRTQAAPTLVA
jgi:hypothetical protein